MQMAQLHQTLCPSRSDPQRGSSDGRYERHLGRLAPLWMVVPQALAGDDDGYSGASTVLLHWGLAMRQVV